MTAESALQKSVYDALRADADVAAIVGARVFDAVPEGSDYPMIVFGSSDMVPVDDVAQCVEGAEVSLQLDCWVRANGRLRPARDLVAAVTQALHRSTLALEGGLRLLSLTASHRVFLDRDGRTAHGVVTLEAEIDGR